MSPINMSPTHISPIQSGQHAIVIGGSIAGLLSARVLSQHFAQVTLIERDALLDRPDCRPHQPHARHIHALLTSGKTVLDHYFPDLIDALTASGAIAVDASQAARWYISGDYRMQYESGMTGIFLSRPFLEWQIRQRVLALANVKLYDNSKVEALITTADRSQVRGVRMQRRIDHSGEALEILADLVVDASGRNSASPGWLTHLGYAAPTETVVTVDLSYTSRIYRRQPHDLENAAYVVVSPDVSHNQRGGLAFPIEGDRWIVGLAGWGEQLPLDPQGFLDFARSLPAADVYELIQRAEPLSEVSGYKFPSSVRRHYEKLRRFPERYLVIGDALCSFDPAYGQGMTVAALQAAQLDTLLQRDRSNLNPQLWKSFFKQAAKLIDIPWQMTVSEDFRFSTTQGKKPLGTELINTYSAWVQRTTHTDPIVYAAFLKVMNLMAPPSSLFRPQIIWHVLRALYRNRSGSLQSSH